MVTLARKEQRSPNTTSRPTAVDATSSAKVRTKLVTEGKELFRSQLRQAKFELPQEQADVYVAAFESAMTEILSSLPKINLCLTELTEREKASSRDAPEAKSPQPTARLRRAMSSAKRIEQGRFATVDEMFRSLGQANKG